MLSRFFTIFGAMALLMLNQPCQAKGGVGTDDAVDDVQVLLITAEELAPAWERFKEWKTSLGKPTKIVTVKQIESQFDAESIQEKIRLCVRQHVEENGTRWVILGGDCLPGGKGLVPGGHMTVHRQERSGIPTDIVYLSPTNWDADEDGNLGEWPDDKEAITYPDGSIGLGRIPVRTAKDVEAFTDKVVAYESQYPSDGFANQMIYTCPERGAYPKVRNSWDGYVSKAWDTGQVGRYFASETPWDEEGEPGSHELTSDNLVELINKASVSKFHIHGHGHLPAWVLEGSRFTANHVGQLENDGAYPLITTVSCNTGEFDSKSDPSIVELMIREPNRGSVAIVAPIRTGKAHFASQSDFRLMMTEGKLDGTTLTMTRYWCNGLGKNLTTGEAMMLAKAEMADDAMDVAGYHLCICELNLLGDPTLDMRASSPRTPKLEVDEAIEVGDQTLEVKTDIPECTICVWKNDEVYEVVQAGADGSASIRIDPKTAGSLKVTVSGPSLNVTSKSVGVGSRP